MDNCRQEQQRDVALYVHVPFCVKRCNYCDFYSTVVGKDSAKNACLVDDYFVTLIQHIKAASQQERYGWDNARISSVYFGGGTPSLVYQYLPAVLDVMRESFTLKGDCEITLEANPESFDQTTARTLADAGFNRVSLGVQSFDDDMLALLGRAHNSAQALASMHAAVNAGMRTSVDLMLGLPEQPLPLLSSEEKRESLLCTDWNALLDLIDHVSVYPLTAEEGTALEEMLDSGQLVLPSEDEVAQQVVQIQSLLASFSFERYEISSYARAGQHSRQNMHYWLGGLSNTGGDYVGFGPSAASMQDLPTDTAAGTRRRFVMYETLDTFLADPTGENWSQDAPEQSELLSSQEIPRENIMLALRTNIGASADYVAAAGQALLCDELVEKGLLQRVKHEAAEPDHYRCTQQGWLLGNIVFSAIWVSGE